MASFNEKVTEFINVTGTTEERAQFFLQAANGELHSALETFFSGNDEEFVDDDIDAHDNNDEVVEQPDPKIIDHVKSTSSLSNKKKVSLPSKFATISSLSKNDDSDEDQGQAFYAGGSERSGQQILGPSRDKRNPTQDLFDAAKRHGAEVVSEIGSSKIKPQSKVFKGAGFKLGSNVEPSKQVNPNLNPLEKQEQPKDVTIKFWKNGFSVDSGPLRDFQDPSNKEFMDSISRGEVPIELRRQVMNGEVHVNMEDHREEDYVKPKETIKAFSGAGQMLGSPAPSMNEKMVSSNQSTTTSSTLNPSFQVDNTRPATTIQIRFSDGTRLISKFNHDNTIGDIRNLVQKARPNNNSFKLLTTFPNKVLENDSLTISEAKLLNAVIVQKLN